MCGLLALTSCGSGTTPAIYVLSPAAHQNAGVVSEAGRPVIALKQISVPDYMDTTDILSRDGQNELKPSLTGRWGERLSMGITRALAVALATRLPGIVVDHTGSAAHPALTLLIDLDAFDIGSDGRCVLTARWTILGEDRQTVAMRRATIITIVSRSSGGPTDAAPTDAAIVAAMAGAVEQLADHVASDLARTSHGADRKGNR